MSTGVPELPKDDFLEQIWTVLTTLSDEAMRAAQKKCIDQGFDENRGIVSLQESFINLASARGLIQDVIEKRKLVQLPITVQKELLGNIQNISRSLVGLSEGTDEVVNLATSIELLNTSIWKYGLHNLSDEVLGYQTKLNQIKNQELHISRVISHLETAQKSADLATAATNEIERRRHASTAALEETQKNNSESAALLEQIRENGSKASALFSTIQQQEKQSGEFTSSIKTSNNELLSLDSSIRKFYGDVDEYRKKISEAAEGAAAVVRTSETSVRKLVEESSSQVDAAIDALNKTGRVAVEELTDKISAGLAESKQELSRLDTDVRSASAVFQKSAEVAMQTLTERTNTSFGKFLVDSTARLDGLADSLNSRSNETVEINQKATEKLVNDLATLKEQIKEQIQQATGFQLFGAFQSRQNQIAGSKNLWVYAIATLVAISAGVTIWIAHEAQYYSVNNLAFWVKLSLTIPLGYALTFCTLQYSRERRLEEEYAFKSSVSVSLNPYRDLIRSILEKDGAADQSKYADFVIDSVKNVFTPPTDKVFDAAKKPGITEKTLKQTAEIIGTAVKAAK